MHIVYMQVQYVTCILSAYIRFIRNYTCASELEAVNISDQIGSEFHFQHRSKIPITLYIPDQRFAIRYTE